ncbi:MAG: TolC family protein [Marinilabiliaceae bacterium]
MILTHQQNEKTQIEIRDAVAKAYFLVLSARENLEAFEKNLKVNRETLEETRSLYENGYREEQDVSQIKLMVKEAEKQIVEVKHNEEVAMAVLRFSMGLNEDQPIHLTDDFDTLSSLTTKEDSGREGWMPKEHINYQIAATNVERQKLELKNIKAQYLPKINAFYTYQKNGYGEEWNLFNNDWYKSQFVGLSISVPIFSSVMRHAQAQQQKLAWEKSKNERKRTLRNIKTQSLTALAEYNSAIDQYEIATESKALASNIYEKNRVKFSNGIAGSSELTQQQEQFIQAQISVVQATLNLLNAKINYLKATGKL